MIDIVHGGKSQKILGKNLDKNPEYAVLSERTVPRLRQILRELQFREYVEEKGRTISSDLSDTGRESIYENGRTADHEASERRDRKEI